MNGHLCTEHCLYCMVNGIYKVIEDLKDDRLRLATEVCKLKREKEEMDKKIKKIEKGTKKLVKEEKELLKEDHKRDKTCAYGEKMMKKKKK